MVAATISFIMTHCMCAIANIYCAVTNLDVISYIRTVARSSTVNN